MFDQKEFNNFILNNGVIGFFDEPIKLKSGRTSNWYVNWRNVAEDVFLIDKLTDFVLDFVNEKEINVDTYYGVPEGATKLGIITQFKFAKKTKNYSKNSHILAMGRAIPKEHGALKDKFFVGMPKGDIIVLEDVTTTGLSILKTIDELQKINLKISAAIGLTNRMEIRDDGKTVKQIIEEKGIKYLSMSNAIDLLPEACKLLKPKESIIKGIEEEFEKYGIEKIKVRQ